MKACAIVVVGSLFFATGGSATAQESQGTITASAPQQNGAAVIVDNGVALRFVTQEGSSAFVRLETSDGAEALSFPVVHMHQALYAGYPGEKGTLYVTRTRVIFEPESGKSHRFNIVRAELKTVKSSKSKLFGRNIGRNILIETQSKTYRFKIAFSDFPEEPDDSDQIAPIGFFYSALDDFDKAFATFRDLTGAVRQKLADKQAQALAEAKANAEAEARAKAEKERIQAEASAQAAKDTLLRERIQAEYNSRLKQAMLGEEQIRATPSGTKDGVRVALRSLRKMAGATEIGITKQEYSSRLIDVKADVDEALAAVPDSFLKTEMNLALQAFIEAGQKWNDTLKYSNSDVSGWIGRSLTPLWQAARTHTDNASLLFQNSTTR